MLDSLYIGTDQLSHVCPIWAHVHAPEHLNWSAYGKKQWSPE